MKNKKAIFLTTLAISGVLAIGGSLIAPTFSEDKMLYAYQQSENPDSCLREWNSSNELVPASADGNRFKSSSGAIQITYGIGVEKGDLVNHCYLKANNVDSYISTEGPVFKGYSKYVNGLFSITVNFDDTVADLKLETWWAKKNSSTTYTEHKVVNISKSGQKINITPTSEGQRPNMFKITRVEKEGGDPNKNLAIKSYSLSCTALEEAQNELTVYTEEELASAVSNTTAYPNASIKLGRDITLTKTLNIERMHFTLTGGSKEQHRSIKAAKDFSGPLVNVNTGRGDLKYVTFKYLDLDGTNADKTCIVENAYVKSNYSKFIKGKADFAPNISIFKDGLFMTFSGNSSLTNSSLTSVTNKNDYADDIYVGDGGKFSQSYKSCTVNNVYVDANGIVYAGKGGINNVFLNTVEREHQLGIADHGTIYANGGENYKTLKIYRNNVNQAVDISTYTKKANYVIRGFATPYNEIFDYASKVDPNKAKDDFYKFVPASIEVTETMTPTERGEHILNSLPTVEKAFITVCDGETILNRTLNINGKVVLFNGASNNSTIKFAYADQESLHNGVNIYDSSLVTFNKLTINGGLGHAVTVSGEETKANFNDGNYYTESTTESTIYGSNKSETYIYGGTYYAPLQEDGLSNVIENDKTNPATNLNFRTGTILDQNPAKPTLSSDAEKRAPFLDKGSVAVERKELATAPANHKIAYDVKTAKDFMQAKDINNKITLNGDMWVNTAISTSSTSISTVFSLTSSIHGNLIFDLNKHTIRFADIILDSTLKGQVDLFKVGTDVNLTITGDGVIDATNFGAATGCIFRVGSYNSYYKKYYKGTLNIENGTFISNGSCVYVSAGIANIKGGSYENKAMAGNGENYLLNCFDAGYTSGNANISVAGGSFIGFNPASCISEGNPSNFVATGYTSKETTTGSNTWNVVKNETTI